MGNYWKVELLKDLDNVKRGKEEEGKDSSQVEAAIARITASDSKDDAMQSLQQYNLNWFASQMFAGTYDRFDVAEETEDEQ
jgi:hypothetical protein